MSSVEFKYDLGLKVKCKVTGFKGVVEARSESLNGCHRYYINPGVDKTGKLQDGSWFDHTNLEVLDKKAVVKHKPVQTGGPIGRHK